MTYNDCIGGAGSGGGPTPPANVATITQFHINSAGATGPQTDGSIAISELPFSFTGMYTFSYTVANPELITGTGNLTQGTTNLSSSIDPSASSITVTVTTAMLTFGDTITFTLQFTGTNNNAITRLFTIRAPRFTDLAFYTVIDTLPDFTVTTGFDTSTFASENVRNSIKYWY